MEYEVFLTRDAETDLEEILGFIESHDSPARALRVLERFEALISGLSMQPNRGSYPKELIELGIREYREVRFKPYRVIYRVMDAGVFVLLIVDGRRDMQSLLQRRLLSSLP